MWLVTILIGACAAASAPGPIVADMPDDLRVVVDETLAAFAEALPSTAPCLESLTITHAWELDHRAEYRPEEAVVVLRVPATRPRLETSLVHEMAHHVDMACPDEEMRSRFLESQGLDGDIPWFDGPSWQDTPSEQFATAAAEVVTGRPDRARPVPVTEDALAVVARWGGD